LAGVPTRRSPFWLKATTDGVVLAPSAFSITFGFCSHLIANSVKRMRGKKEITGTVFKGTSPFPP
jgi:hypothetical protein